MSHGQNPYAPTNHPGFAMPTGPSAPLADLGKRFLGAIIDLAVYGLCFLPGFLLLLMSAGEPNQEPPPIFFVGLGLMLVGFLAFLGLQIYLLATRSQTVGKYFVGTQIVDYQTRQPAGIVNTLLLRTFVNGIIAGLPCVGGIYAIVDICFIFRDDRRCIHDLIASTVVVDIGR
jgi:uncharacterized RDD family membrane protein YckC